MTITRTTFRCDWTDPDDPSIQCNNEVTVDTWTGTSDEDHLAARQWWHGWVGDGGTFEHRCPPHKPRPEIKPWHWYRTRPGGLPVLVVLVDQRHGVFEVDAPDWGRSQYPLAVAADYELIGPCEVPQ